MMIDVNLKVEQAMANFAAGYNCCQAVLLAFSDFTGLETELASTIAAPLGGGMGRLREVCGAVSGMFLVSGFLTDGASDIANREAKKQCYATVQGLASEFRASNGSIICRELLSSDVVSDKSSVPAERTAEYYKKRPCKELVGDAARIVAEYINNRENQATATNTIK